MQKVLYFIGNFPGIPHSRRIFEIASSNGIAITSDVELFVEENPASEFIFITVTNGKSRLWRRSASLTSRTLISSFIAISNLRKCSAWRVLSALNLIFVSLVTPSTNFANEFDELSYLFKNERAVNKLYFDY